MSRALPFVLLLAAACSDRLAGTYRNEQIALDFEPGGVVRSTMMGHTAEGTYEVDGERVVVRFGGASTIYLKRDGELQGPLGVVLKKE